MTKKKSEESTKKKSTQAKRPADKKAGKSAQAAPAQKGATDFPIVGIGASAGGLAAFEAFFSGMPADSNPGMAFVLVQHLAPDHKSILTELIRRYTRMKVYEVEDGMEVMPNCAYIIPPNKDMAFLNGKLQLLEPAASRGLRLPIDFFFRSLAQDQGNRAICIVLSGTGSDGSQGVREIKGQGGLAIAQNPDSTEYDGMPRNAIATGLVDYVLPPAKMAPQLISYVIHAFKEGKGVTLSQLPKSENALKKIFILIRSQMGHDFSQYKASTIDRRIERRMAVSQINTLEQYVAYLQKTPSEVETLFHDLLIGVTNFFRDPDAFSTLEKEVIPNLFTGKSDDEQIRIWIPGCATGEEAYSIAILLAEHQSTMKMSFRVQIFATDIDKQAITMARSGVFPGSIRADVSEERLMRYFSPVHDSTGGNPSAYRIHKSIRDMLIFSEQDLVKDPHFSRLDLISCRNLLIYMTGELQKKIIPLFHYALNPNGYLFLGTSETVGEFSNLFKIHNRKSKIYEHKFDMQGAQALPRKAILPPLTPIDDIAVPHVEKAATFPKLPLRDLTERALLQEKIPSAALVNDQGDILYIHGRTGMYLEPAQGEAGVNNILKMARQGLQREVTTALHKAKGTMGTVRHDGLKVKTNGNFTFINLVVRPVQTGSKDVPLFLVILEEMPETQAMPITLAEEDVDPLSVDERILVLKQELKIKEDYLQSANEELETSNEELKSSNEEMQSVNEELQCTNEELETSKEELQSVNEELATVNAELQTKVVELTRLNNDMNNLLAGSGIATVFLDVRLNILRFTPSTTEIINLIQGDIGRPIGHIVSNLIGENNLVDDAKRVLDTLIPIECNVQVQNGKWYLMRILPYRTLDNVIEGVVLTFIDISESKNIHDKLLMNEERMRVALDMSPISVFNQDLDLKYTWIHNPNPAFNSELVIGKKDEDLLPADTASILTALKEEVIKTGQGAKETILLTIEHVQYSYNLTIEPLLDSMGKVQGITCASVEVPTPETREK